MLVQQTGPVVTLLILMNVLGKKSSLCLGYFCSAYTPVCDIVCVFLIDIWMCIQLFVTTTC